MNNSRVLTIRNAKFPGYYFYMNLNIWGDFQFCISVPLKIRVICEKSFMRKKVWKKGKKKRSVSDALRDLVPFAKSKKTVKNTHGAVILLVKLTAEDCNFTKSITSPWVFFTFFKLHKWYKIAQSITFVIYSNISIMNIIFSKLKRAPYISKWKYCNKVELEKNANLPSPKSLVKQVGRSVGRKKFFLPGCFKCFALHVIFSTVVKTYQPIYFFYWQRRKNMDKDGGFNFKSTLKPHIFPCFPITLIKKLN